MVSKDYERFPHPATHCAWWSIETLDRWTCGSMVCKSHLIWKVSVKYTWVPLLCVVLGICLMYQGLFCEGSARKDGAERRQRRSGQRCEFWLATKNTTKHTPVRNVVTQWEDEASSERPAGPGGSECVSELSLPSSLWHTHTHADQGTAGLPGPIGIDGVPGSPGDKGQKVGLVGLPGVWDNMP